jgi:plasmid stabilization system protein ParE
VKRVVFHPEAEAEFLAAARFYDAHQPGLGLDFVTEVQRAARVLVAHPRLGRRFSRRLRRILVRRFPYGLLYRLEANEIFIVAVAHLRRRPGYWRRRERRRPA